MGRCGIVPGTRGMWDMEHPAQCLWMNMPDGCWLLGRWTESEPCRLSWALGGEEDGAPDGESVPAFSTLR